nr:hypothetical protein [Trinickia mobilis]
MLDPPADLRADSFVGALARGPALFVEPDLAPGHEVRRSERATDSPENLKNFPSNCCHYHKEPYVSVLRALDLKCFIKLQLQRKEKSMSKRTMRLVRTLSDIRRAQRCTALRAARQAAELAALAAEASEPEPPTSSPDLPPKRERRECATETISDFDLSIYAG